MHLITLVQQKFSQICPVLPGNAGNQSTFHYLSP
jgi:hypothetical protein